MTPPIWTLAIRRGLPLACNDGKLKTAALAAGVALFTPLPGDRILTSRHRAAPAFPRGSIGRSPEPGRRRAPILAGDLRRAILEDRPEEVLDLEGVVVGGGVDRGEPGAVLGLESLEQVLLAGDGPEVVERRLGDRGHARR